MSRIRVFLIILCFPLMVQAQSLTNGTLNLTINGTAHWVKVAGAEHKTVPLVIMHGGPGGNHYVFERLAGKELEKFSTVIYYEQRGSGRSAAAKDGRYTIPLMVSDLEALRKHFGLTQVIPLGYSFGASLAVEYALAYPKNVKGLILESFATLQDSSVLLSQMANFYAQARAEKRSRMDSILTSNTSLTEKNMAFWSLAQKDDVIRFLFRDSQKGKLVFDMWAESKIGNTGEVMQALLKETRKVNLYDEANRIKAPVLILTGVYDRNGALPASIRIREEIPKSRIKFFENSAHFPDVEETQLFVRTIKEWLGQLK